MAKKSSKANKPSGNMMMKQKDMMMPNMPMKGMGAKMGNKPASGKKSSKKGK